MRHKEDGIAVGQTYAHSSGMRVKVIALHVPGDRDDSGRVLCEVVARFTERLGPEKLELGYVDYELGHLDGWWLWPVFSWEACP